MIDIDKEINKSRRFLGKEIGVSKWINLDQNTISQFSDLSMDPNFIHVDEERTKSETPFQGTIAHGFLVLSFASRFALDAFPDRGDNSFKLNYGFNKIRFVSPVASGSKIRGRFVLSDVSKKRTNGILETFDLTIETAEEEKPAVSAEWLTLTLYN